MLLIHSHNGTFTSTTQCLSCSCKESAYSLELPAHWNYYFWYLLKTFGFACLGKPSQTCKVDVYFDYYYLHFYIWHSLTILMSVSCSLGIEVWLTIKQYANYRKQKILAGWAIKDDLALMLLSHRHTKILYFVKSKAVRKCTGKGRLTMAWHNGM